MKREQAPKLRRVRPRRTPARSTAPSSSLSPAGPFRVALTLAVFAVGFAALQVGSYTTKSATWDEPGHLLAGYLALSHGDHRLDIEHPPLFRMWEALPLLFMPVASQSSKAMDDSTPESVAFLGPFGLGHRFLYKDNPADELLYAARFMTVVVGVGLGLLVFCWLYEWIGYRAATIALALYTVESNIAAHSALVTTDLGVACFMFGAIYFLWRMSRRLNKRNVAGLVACFVVAVLTKFSAIILGPILLALIVMLARRGGAFTWARATGIVGLLIVSTWIGTWAVYGFRFTPSSSRDWVFTLHDHPAVRQAVPGWAAVVGWIDEHHLLPNAASQGFLHGQGLIQGRPAFLAGRYSNFGWWYYFPFAFLLKTSLAVLVLFFIGVALCIKRRRVLSTDGEVFVLLPIAGFLAVAMTSSLNIGVRHILPIYPLVIVLCGLAGNALLAGTRKRGRIVLGLALAVAVVEFGGAYPDNLAFFNMFAGGSQNGFRYLADSNVDWGQDLKALRSWMDRHDVDHINLAYFGTADPEYYGINSTYIWGTTIPDIVPSRIGPPKLPGYVAASVTLLNGVPFGDKDRDFYKLLRGSEPAAIIGGSIRVYWVERPWW